jgi:hypothetical protein
MQRKDAEDAAETQSHKGKFPSGRAMSQNRNGGYEPGSICKSLKGGGPR